jgi:hypothetical protein
MIWSFGIPGVTPDAGANEIFGEAGARQKMQMDVAGHDGPDKERLGRLSINTVDCRGHWVDQ